jgi:hypothetical protein
MKNLITVDGNEAAASVAFRVSESIAIFPITPSSPMAEICDEWASRGKTNLWGVIPEIAEMQSEGGASFVACHQFEFVDKIDVLEYAAEGAVFLLNASGDPATVWDRLPREMQQQIMEKHIRFFVIDAYALANQAGMGAHAQWTTSLSVTAN